MDNSNWVARNDVSHIMQDPFRNSAQSVPDNGDLEANSFQHLPQLDYCSFAHGETR